MKLLDKYFSTKHQIHEYFGYVEDWVDIPLSDERGYYWKIVGGDEGEVHYADSEEELKSESGNYYVDSIYTQRFLPKWVYRGPDYTMISCNPGVDGNKFLRVFDNKLERP